jgi:hypothetical protein
LAVERLDLPLAVKVKSLDVFIFGHYNENQHALLLLPW